MSILMSLAIAATTSMAPYSKYACKQVLTNGVATVEPYYGSNSSYAVQPVQLPSMILNGSNSTTPISIVSLSQFWKFNIQGGGSTSLDFTHAINQKISVNGTEVILYNSVLNNTTEANVVIQTYSDTCANVLASALKKQAYQNLYSMTIDVTQQEAKQIIREMDSNTEFNNIMSKELQYQQFNLGQEEASYIYSKDPSGGYFTKQDIFKEGNELVSEGKIKGSGMDLTGNTSDLMNPPSGESYSQSVQGLLYGFPPKPKNVPVNNQTVKEYQEQQAKTIEANNSQSTPVEGAKPISSQITQPVATQSMQPNTQESVNSSNSSLGWLNLVFIVIILLGIGCFGVAGYILWKRYKSKKDYDDFPDL